MIGRLGPLSKTRELPIPPIAMRELVGTSETEAFDQPRGKRVYPTIKRRRQYEMVLDFGCGCGRIARQLALASRPMPKRYVGVDLHAGMIEWCAGHLTPVLPGFTFVHHNVYNPGLNPDPDLPRTAPLPAEDGSVSLLIAHSVFTHLLQEDAVKYLDEVRRVSRPDGVVVATFFCLSAGTFR
jgi:SAM-dependent methyltransferase